MKHIAMLIGLFFIFTACATADTLSNYFSNNDNGFASEEAAYKKMLSVPYENKSVIAKPNQETALELSDGAAVIVPAASASQEVKIVLERNPDKSKKMPPIGDFVIPLSSFYNIVSDGDGLVGPLEIHLPIDKTLIPKDMDGSFIALYPDGKGAWRSGPVEENNGKVILYTDDLGDPLIALHFTTGNEPGKKITLEKILRNRCGGKLFGIGEEDCKTKAMQEIMDLIKRNSPLCDPVIALQVITKDGRLGSQIEVFGSVTNDNARFAGGLVPENLQNLNQHLPVTIKVNYKDIREKPITIDLQTNPEGNFQFTLDSNSPNSGLKEGWNWIFANAKCPGGNGFPESESKGYAEFKLLPKETENIQPAAAIEKPEPLPGTIALPDVRGLFLEDATAELKDLGFRTTWVDGKSTSEVGKIYDQEPKSGSYQFPYRTTVILYRSMENTNEAEQPQAQPQPAAQDEYGCNKPSLTPEEKANCGEHIYKINSCTCKPSSDDCNLEDEFWIKNGCKFSDGSDNTSDICGDLGDTFRKINNFSNGIVTHPDYEQDVLIEKRIGNNEYDLFNTANSKSTGIKYKYNINGYSETNIEPSYACGSNWIKEYLIISDK